MKLRRRLNQNIILSIVVMALVSVFIFIPVQKKRVETVNRKLIALMGVFISRDNTAIANAIFENRNRAIDVRMDKIAELDDVNNASVFNSNYKLLTSSNPGMSRETLIHHFRVATEKQFASWTTTDSLWYLQSINLFDETIGFVLIEYSLTDMNKRAYINIVVLALLLFAIPVMLLLIVNHMINKRIIKPVNQLIGNMSAIKEGQYGKQIDIDADDEIGELATQYNDMSNQVSYSYNRVVTASNMLENVIDSMPSILFSINGDNAVTAWNSAAEKFTGLKRTAVIGNHFIECFPLLKPYQELIVKVATEKRPELLTGVSVDEHYYDISFYPLVSIRSSGAVIRLDDVTEIRKNEEQLQQSQKMETVGTLAGGLAHDFNNVLGGIIGATSIVKHRLERDVIEPKKLMTYMDMIEHSSNRAAGMVKQLMTISKKYEVTMATVDLNVALENVVAICRNTFDKQIKIEVKYCPGKALVYGNGNQIEQILLNICVNASHAMTIMRESGNYEGTLNLFIHKLDIDTQDTLFGKIENESMFEVTIADTGIGIAADKIKSIFDPFYSSKPHESGTGLGLSMVFSMLKKHNGYVDVLSAVGTGTTFKIYLPVEKNVTAGVQVPSHDLTIPKGNGTVLVVDDETIIRETAKGMLELCGYSVILASSGADGLDHLDRSAESIDLILLDMAMPEMSGKEVLLKIRELYPDKKVLLASGNSLDERVIDVLNSGVDGFISKPFQIKGLADKVYEIMKS